jgi:hypothetical protein
LDAINDIARLCSMSLERLAASRENKDLQPAFVALTRFPRMFELQEHQRSDKRALVRSFSDEWHTQEPNNALSQSLAAKVEQDRKADSDKARRREEWALLFTDAGRLAE